MSVIRDKDLNINQVCKEYPSFEKLCEMLDSCYDLYDLGYVTEYTQRSINTLFDIGEKGALELWNVWRMSHESKGGQFRVKHEFLGKKVLGLDDTNYSGYVATVIDYFEYDTSSAYFQIKQVDGTIEAVPREVFSEEFVFYNDDLGCYTLETGQPVCEGCYKPIRVAIQTQYDDISWKWNPKTNVYEKTVDGSAGPIRCNECDISIELGEDVFSY